MAAVILLLAFLPLSSVMFMYVKFKPHPTAVANAAMGTIIVILGAVLGFNAGGDSGLLVVAWAMVSSIFIYRLPGLSVRRQVKPYRLLRLMGALYIVVHLIPVI